MKSNSLGNGYNFYLITLRENLPAAKTDEFLEKFQTAFDPPASASLFWKKSIAIFCGPFHNFFKLWN